VKRRPSRCSWCESDRAFPTWAVLDLEGVDELFAFCHAGCLAHWLFANEPAYFDELEVVPK
jgi:hypothetical protein